MSLSIGGGNFTPNPQLNTYELTVSTQDEVSKKGDPAGTGNKVVIQRNTDDIIFTQMDRDSKNEYPITPGRPTILPAGSSRSAGPNAQENGEEAVEIFNKLFSELPLEIQKLIQEARDQDALVSKEVLQNTAKALEILQKALLQIEIKDRTAAQFPIDVFKTVARIGKEFTESAKGTLEINEPSYLPSKELIDELEGLLDKAKLPEKDDE